MNAAAARSSALGPRPPQEIAAGPRLPPSLTTTEAHSKTDLGRREECRSLEGHPRANVHVHAFRPVMDAPAVIVHRPDRPPWARYFRRARLPSSAGRFAKCFVSVSMALTVETPAYGDPLPHCGARPSTNGGRLGGCFQVSRRPTAFLPERRCGARRERARSPKCVRGAAPRVAGCSSFIPADCRPSSRTRTSSGPGSRRRWRARAGPAPVHGSPRTVSAAARPAVSASSRTHSV